MKRKIIVNNKEFTMPKMSIDTYTEYLELAEVIDAKQRYSKQDIEAMSLFICKAYGNQFTVEELKNPETGLDAAGLILEFQLDVYKRQTWKMRREAMSYLQTVASYR